jgi:O-antigen/teichoic acid export membrane protein
MDEKTPTPLAAGARTGLLGSIGGRFLNVLGNIIIARLLGPAAFGLYAIGWTLMRFFSLILPLGMERGILFWGPKYWQKDEPVLKGLFLRTHAVALFTGVLLGLSFFLGAPLLANNIYHKPELIPLFRLFSFAFPALSLLTVTAASTRITQKVKYSVLVQDLGQPVLGILLMLALFLMGLNVQGIVLAEVVSLIIAAFLGLFLISILFPGLKKSSVASEPGISALLKYSLPAMAGGAFSVYILWFDRIVVGLFLNSYDNGIYLAVSQISTIVMVVMAGFSPITVPLFSNYYHQNNRQKLEEVYRVSTKWGIYLCMPILAVLCISPSASLSFLFGTQYSSGANLLLVLLAGQFINLLTGSVNPLLVMTQNQKVLFKLSAIALLMDLISLFIFVPRYGTMAAAVCTSVWLSVLYTAQVVWVKRHLNLLPYNTSYLKGVVASAGSFVSVFLVHGLFPNHLIWGIIIQSISAIASFILVLFLLKLDPEDKEMIRFSKVKLGSK